MLCFRFSKPGNLNITERLVFNYDGTYYSLISLIPFPIRYHKRISHFRLERWLKKEIELVSYGNVYKFSDTIKQFLEDIIPVESLEALCRHHVKTDGRGEDPILGDPIKFKDVIPY